MRKLSLLAIVFWCAFSVGCAPKPSPDITHGIEQTVDFIELFSKKNKRFPTDTEFSEWRERTMPSGIVQFEIKITSNGMRYYIIYSWSGERMWEYSSLDHRIRPQDEK